ncbi:MAG: ATP-binding protein [Alphaproteobacteria bacterium]
MDQQKSFKQQLIRDFMMPFTLVLVISIVIIGGLVALSKRSQEQVAEDSSLHLARSVLEDIERRLADQLLDYSYWDQAVENLVTHFNANWADNNVGIYMNQRFDISSSYVLDGDNIAIYGMKDGNRTSENPFERFQGGLEDIVKRARLTNPTEPPVTASGYVTDGNDIHIAAASVLTRFPETEDESEIIATDSVLIYVRSFNKRLLAELSHNYLLNDLRTITDAENIATVGLPLFADNGMPIGFLTWRLDSPARKMMTWLLPLIVVVMMVFAATSYIFFKRMQRTAETLYQAKEEAESASKQKSKFLSSMSHEFRTPLNAILGFSDLMRKQKFGPLGSERYEEYAEFVHSSGQHMLTLVNDVLDMAAIEAGRHPIIKEPVHIHPMIEKCIQTVRPMADEKSLMLNTAFPENLPRIVVDRRSFIQIVLNALSNAIKFTKHDGHISISANFSDDSVTIVIVDTGIGIPAHIIPHITKPFAQGHSNSNVTQDGTGLGLSIAKSLIDANEGILAIESEVGTGTSLYITFPAERQNAPA